MTNQKIIKKENKKFWSADIIPDANTEILSDGKVKILYDTTLSEILKEQKHRLHPEQAIQMIEDINEQMILMLKNKITVAFFDIEDIIIIDKRFYFLNDKKIVDVEKKYFKISKVYPKSMFKPYELNPNEQTSIELPLTLHQNTYMYSLALLVIYSLFNISIETREKALIVLEQLRGTALFWCLNRCLTLDEKERILLII